MALSFQAVQKAYKVLNIILQTEFIPSLQNSECPEDISYWDHNKKANPEEYTLYGLDKKDYGGWESIFFFASNPSSDLKQLFDSMKDKVPNSTLSKVYRENSEFWQFGWY